MGILCTNYETLSNIFPSPLFFNSKPKTPNLFSVMPEISCRASTFLLFLDSRQVNAGMTRYWIPARYIPEIFCRGKSGMTALLLLSTQNSKLKTSEARNPLSGIQYLKHTGVTQSHHTNTIGETLKRSPRSLSWRTLS